MNFDLNLGVCRSYELKDYCRIFKLKLSGNKKELIKRISIYLQEEIHKNSCFNILPSEKQQKQIFKSSNKCLIQKETCYILQSSKILKILNTKTLSEKFLNFQKPIEFLFEVKNEIFG